MVSFAIERLHLRVKRVAHNVKRLGTYERSTLSGTINSHVASLRERSGPAGLLGRTAPFPGLPSALVADSAEHYGMRVRVGGHVFRGESFGVVRACCQEGLLIIVIVDVLHVVAIVSPHSSRWNNASCTRALWRPQDLNECAAWQELSERSEVVAIRL